MDLTIFLGSVLICQVVSYEYMPPNMGTVLYTSNDCARRKWDKDDLALIQARMYGQQLVPPIYPGVVVNEKYIKTLMNYFRNTYDTIKLESRDARIGEIMTAAVSDALGGYVKSWMIPITKFAFYGGTVSKESAQRVMSFYGDIKLLLATDGSSWRNPDLEDLRYVAVNIPPPPAVSSTRFIVDPCRRIAFFEKSDNELKIPIPTISWGDGGPMMFLPLRRRSIISLTSPSSTDALYRYYEAAKRCAKAPNGFDEADFDNRFESWLVTKVLPHLNDDKLYYGLNSVFTLLNKTHDFSDKIINLYVNRGNYTKLSSPSYGSCMSKKVIIITVILFLEICWCIPAMFYMKLSKNKRKTRSKENFLNVCMSYGDKALKGINVIEDVKKSKQKDDHGVKFQGQQRIKNKQSDSRKRYVYNNPTHITKRTNPRLNDQIPLIIPSDKIHPASGKGSDFIKMEPYFISNASVDNSSSVTPQKNLDKAGELPTSKTVTLFRNNEPRKVFKEKARVQTTKPKSRNSQVTILKDLPVVFQDPLKNSSIISTKITKIVIASDKREEKGKFYNTHKQIKTHSNEKGYYKHNAIILSRKGTKSNVEKQFGIKIERQETDFASLDGNEKTACTKSNKAIVECSKLRVQDVKTEPVIVPARSKHSSTQTNIQEKLVIPEPTTEKDSKEKEKNDKEQPSGVNAEDTIADDANKLSTAI